MKKPAKANSTFLPSGTPALPHGPPEARATSSYKCEECGKIIAAPSANPIPLCCGEPMKKIR